jgi:hypothetical protein
MGVCLEGSRSLEKSYRGRSAQQMYVHTCSCRSVLAIDSLFHNLKGGGLYLTDSIIAAAQFVCWQEGREPTNTAHVLSEFLFRRPYGSILMIIQCMTGAPRQRKSLKLQRKLSMLPVD